MVYEPKSYWDSRAEAWKGSGVPQEFDNLVECLDPIITDKTKILDLGPGDGHILLKLEELYEGVRDRYTMCDVSTEMAAKCTKNTGIAPDIWDGKKLPYPNVSYDIVLLLSVLLHVTPDNIKDFLLECRRVTRKVIFISTWHNPDEARTAGAHCFQHNYKDIFLETGFKIAAEYKTMKRGSSYRRRNWLIERA